LRPNPEEAARWYRLAAELSSVSEATGSSSASRTKKN
jgi:hypothetical protein